MIMGKLKNTYLYVLIELTNRHYAEDTKLKRINDMMSGYRI